MSKIITAVMLALAMALANVAIGAGTGMPMMRGLKDPTVLADLVDRALARDSTGHSLLDSARCKKDGSCATAHDYFHGIQVAHPSAKLGDIADLPRYLRSLAKQPAPAGEWYMSRLLVKGEKRTYDHMAWHRAFFKGEDAWADVNTGEFVLAGFCENVVGALKSPAAEKETPVKKREIVSPQKIATCPDIYFLKINVWERKALSLPGVEATHAKEELGNKRFSTQEKVSSKHGGQFRRAYAEGVLKRSAVPREFRVSFIMTPEAQEGEATISDQEFVHDVTVTGLLELQFSRAQLEQWDAIRVIAIDGDMVSPPRSNDSGFRELRFFNRLPGKKLGEWDNNPVPDCIMNEHWIE